MFVIFLYVDLVLTVTGSDLLGADGVVVFVVRGFGIVAFCLLSFGVRLDADDAFICRIFMFDDCTFEKKKEIERKKIKRID